MTVTLDTLIYALSSFPVRVELTLSCNNSNVLKDDDVRYEQEVLAKD